MRKIVLAIHVNPENKKQQKANVCIMYAMKRTNIFLPEQLLKALRAVANKTGLSVAEIVRRAIGDFLERRK